MRICLRSVAFFLGLVAVLPAAEIDFDRDIAPLLIERCLGCHRGEDAEAQLDLTTLESLLAGGENGAALVPGDSGESLLWQRVAAGEMPEDKPLPADEKALLQQWIASGAKWGKGPIDPLGHTTSSRAGYDWWSLQPLSKVEVPLGPTENAVSNPIDLLVRARLAEAGLQPSPPASSNRLVRRLHFGLTGLPPEPRDLDRDVSGDESWQRMVDELLASPRHGPQWARHWLDVVRFGESHGFEYNQPRNNAWWYRDWVIESINRDMPYDEFVRQQLAGDVLYPDDADAWAATGFIVAGPHNTTKPSSEKMQMTMRHDELEDIVGAIGQTFLGLTVNCARCHDHKFDPISQKEYYQLVASVVGVDHGERELPNERAAVAKRERKQVRAILKEKRDELKRLEAGKEDGGNGGKAADPEELEQLRMHVKQLQEEDKRLGRIRGPVMYTAISRKPPEVQRLRRGDVTLPAEPVEARGLRAINASLADFGLDTEASDARRRANLANWIVGDQNPLLARVIVNRIWHHHFGQGLVRTPSDFGFNGDRPSHPELLDFLAAELIRHDWSLKPLHRLIVTSATYRQSSRLREDAQSVDADNRLLWRMNPRRLTAEEMRDAMLSAAGQLDDYHGGPGYRDVREYKYRGSHYYDPVEPEGVDAVRRTVYRFSPRGGRRTILDTFDCPDPSAKAPTRNVTITPLQALALMNNRFVLKTSDALADRVSVVAESKSDVRTAVRKMFRLVYGREASSPEVDRLVAFVSEHDMASLARVMFNSNEFLYVR